MQRTTVDSLLRSTQAYCSQLCDKQTLDYGIAYYSRRFARLPEANQFREVVIEDAARVAEAFEQAEQRFRQEGLFCYRWAPAEGKPSDELAAFLVERGFAPHRETAMLLTDWIDVEADGDVQLLPARAMRAALRQTVEAGATDSVDPSLAADALDERMDDPQFDMFVAMVERKPAGRCALYQVGDIARIMHLAVSEGFEPGRVERALLGHVLALAKRLMMRRICVQADADDSSRRQLYEGLGFTADGDIVEFRRSEHGTRERTC